MKNTLMLFLTVALFHGCEDSVVQPPSLNELLHGVYAGVTMYWIPAGSSPQNGMYCACPNDRTGIDLALNGNFLMNIEARVERRDTVYSVTLSGYYEILNPQYSAGGGGSLPHWEGELAFTPSEGQPFQTHFTIHNAVSSPLQVNCLLPVADSSSFYIRGWRRRTFVNAGC